MADGLLMVLMGAVLWRFAKQAEHQNEMCMHNQRIREGSGPVQANKPPSTQEKS